MKRIIATTILCVFVGLLFAVLIASTIQSTGSILLGILTPIGVILLTILLTWATQQITKQKSNH